MITVGDGSPGDGATDANTTGADHSVNLAPGGLLTGPAWGETIGWIRLSGAIVTPAACPADLNASGQTTVQDLFDSLAAYFAGCA